MTDEAIRHLKKTDPVLGRVIKAVGPCTLTVQSRRAPFESLVRAVSHQQLHGKAAESILKRFMACFPGRRFPRPADLATISDEAMRSAGFSGAKVAALRDIAAKTIEGIVPGPTAIKNMPDEEIIERLTMVRGVGRWTVEMLLIFQLGRPDVLPVDDFGVRNGFRRAYGLPEMPKPKELAAHGARWAPYRTTAAWYLWRAADDEAAAGI
jgi:DNA-3-methyladenine glycosylase II